ncbi:TldD/PmbA family protein [Geodermatophilus sp. TF02-6]|uniref:TldD/PmbA family protein n=1 Tax=Geodermatophilus sp. TF02-6 TaxID=2250575 RepID=UPI000DEA144F|nr:TldD/PmbA family protein [Geodermatophilus sp. TF02-6]RBY81609.1 TldD/PmbA family protein [Geodermatophilus sp. TF02-6]
MAPRDVDASFLALPLSALADAALTRAVDLGCEHADLRVERIRTQTISLRDARLESLADGEDLGLSVRVLAEGTWGFAAGVVLTAAEAVRLAEEAVAVAQVSAAVNSDRVELAPEPAYPDAAWVSDYDVDPFDVPDADKTALLTELSEQLLAADGVEHVQTGCTAVKEQKYYADTAGTRTRQQRVRVQADLTALTVDRTTGAFESMRTLAPPAGRGWEYLTGTGWDWRGELAEIPELLREKTKAPSVQPGRYDLVVHPSNLWLTIHESIGHATELDRALGYEAAYAGTSFATVDKLGTLRYGSELMQVTGDRTAPHGLSTVGWDDEGVAGQRWDLVRDGVLVGYQVDRHMAHLRGLPRSNGCAFADSPLHVPIQRMANVSLQPAPGGPSVEEVLGGVERGIYVVGDKSWSIDMQRYNFQFTGQRFYRVENGRLAGQLRDVAYQATTTDFWGSMAVVGGPQTYVLGGAFNCGKGQPGQVAPVSHGCPVAVFENVNILNTVQEAGR